MSSLSSAFASDFFRRALIEALLVGALAGIVGAQVMMRRLSFFVAGLSHATFPGVVIASLFGVSLFVGGAVAGLAVVAALVVIGASRDLDNSTVIGVVLAGAFAVGVLLLTASDSGPRSLAAFLVGSILTVSSGDLIVTATTAACVALVLGLLHKELVLSAFDGFGARAAGYRVALLDACVLACVACSIVVVIPAVGTLLAIALVTVPALTARLWTDRLDVLIVLAAVLGSTCSFVGLCASAVCDIAAGASIALTICLAFFASLAVTSARSALIERSHRLG